MHYELYFTDVCFVFFKMCKIHKIKNMSNLFVLYSFCLWERKVWFYIYYYYYYLNHKLAQNSHLIFSTSSTSCLIRPLIVKWRELTGITSRLITGLVINRRLHTFHWKPVVVYWYIDTRSSTCPAGRCLCVCGPARPGWLPWRPWVLRDLSSLGTLQDLAACPWIYRLESR